MTCSSWVALHGMAHSFTGLYKPVGHDKAVIYEGIKDSWESENSPSESTPGLGLKKNPQRQTRSDCTVTKVWYSSRIQNIEQGGAQRSLEGWEKQERRETADAGIVQLEATTKEEACLVFFFFLSFFF